jgi:hypothetical protein
MIFLLLYCFALLGFYLAIVIHEAGHAVIGRMAGFAISSVGLGTALPFFAFPVGQTRVYLCRVRPFQGLTLALHPEILPSRWAWATFVAGGAVANLLAALISFALWNARIGGEPYCLIFAGINGFFAAVNLLPFTFSVGANTMASDGMLMLQSLIQGVPGADPRMTIGSIDGLGPLWRAVGDRNSLVATLDVASTFCVQIKDAERARGYFAEADALSEFSHPSVQLLHELARASLAMATKEHDRAAEAIRKAGDLLPQRNPLPAQWLISLSETRLRLEQADFAGGSIAAERLGADPFARMRPHLAAAALGLRIGAEEHGDDVALVDRLATQYSKLRSLRPSSGEQLATFRSLGRFWTKVGDGPRARASYRKAFDALKVIAGGMSAAPDRARFLELQADALQEIRDSFADATEASAVADEIDELLAVGEDRAARIHEAWAKAERPRFRWALRLFLFNLFVIAIAVGRIGAGTRGDPKTRPVVVAAIALAVTDMMILPLFIARFVQHRLQPRSMTSWSRIALWIVAAGWLLAGYCALLFILGKPR